MNKLKELRNELNLSQTDVAKKIYMSQNGYSQYELEKNDIPTDVLKKLATFYNTSIDYILGETNNKNAYNKSKIKDASNPNRLKEIREDRDLYQKDIASALGMSQTGYSKYEVGTNDIPTIILKKLAVFYNVSIDYLLYFTDNRNRNRNEVIKITFNNSRLKNLRKDNDLTIKDIASKLNVSEKLYNKYENDITTIPLEILTKLAIFYETSIDYIVGLSDK